MSTPPPHGPGRGARKRKAVQLSVGMPAALCAGLLALAPAAKLQDMTDRAH
jgi:hypothetical protein